MDKNLIALAHKIQVLKQADKDILLSKIRNCSVLFDPKAPKDIPDCPVNERLFYKISLLRHLYYKFEGEPYINHSDRSYHFSNLKKIKKMKEQDKNYELIANAIHHYCNSSEEDKLSFEKTARRINLLAPFLRKKARI